MLDFIVKANSKQRITGDTKNKDYIKGMTLRVVFSAFYRLCSQLLSYMLCRIKTINCRLDV